MTEAELRELDVEVAVKVMGYRWEGSSRGTRRLLNPVGKVVAVKDRGQPISFMGWQKPELPKFSTDIAAAWQVVEKVQSRFPWWRFSILGDDERFAGWKAEFFGEQD